MRFAATPAGHAQDRATKVRWWYLLAAGTVFVLFALAIPQFGLTTVRSVAILLGIVLLLSAASELLAATATARDWQWSHVLLAVLLVAGGVAALVWSQPTFTVAARIVAWYFLIKGVYDIVNSFIARRAERYGAAEEDPRGTAQWWMPLAIGVLEIGVAFWAVSYPRLSISLLVLWVGLAALSTGLTKIAMSFRKRGLRGDLPTFSEGHLPPVGFGTGATREAGRVEAGRAEESRARGSLSEGR
ncbi:MULTISPECIES: HdeD family acid-resistance protein [Protofrankia]|uniref:DUF308 domain-containing protein n=1 Tax=Protofrankia coriariae TaxID=1562887 RepID=A0ABR5F275_9ACTN|nr:MULTISPECIES: DUF308 domain-containing protein [Protofrankia]KLL10823.1 hypothetical protein FrCorBMG51_15515 [Protofrankia coriariae]ONH34025.1 hypothetical protein BL254_18480 [Protofrankia sp. BMG5.30]